MKFRWLRRIFVLIVVLLILGAIAVQIVLWTAYPKRLVIAEIEQGLGLRLSAESLTTGWLGHTELRDVTLALPLGNEHFLDVPRMRVSHTWLPAILLGRPVRVRAMELDSPKLVVRQNEAGRWNVQEVAELISRATGAKRAGKEAAKPDANVTLPRISVTDGSVRVIDRNGREGTFSPLTLSGAPQGELLWRFDTSIADRIKLAGEIVPGGVWQHEVNVDADDLGALLSPWVAHWPRQAKVAGTWRGQTNNGAVTGRLDLKELLVQLDAPDADAAATTLRASGALALATAADGSASLEPTNLIVRTSDERFPEVRVNDGTLSVRGDRVRADGVQLGLAGGLVQLTGSWGWGDGSADVNLAWTDVSYPRNATHTGKMTATLRMPWPNQPEITAQVESRGRTDFGDWESTVHLEGNGPAWSQINWRLSAPRLAYHNDRNRYSLDELVADVTTRGHTLTLTRVALPDESRLQGRGAIDLDTRNWFLFLDGRQWSFTRPATGMQATASRVIFDAWGDAKAARLNQIYIASGDVSFMADGFYIFNVPKPVVLNVSAWSVNHTKETPPDELPIRGELLQQASLVGTVQPLDLAVLGTVWGHELMVRDRAVGDISLSMSGRIDEQRVLIETQHLALLGGQGWLRASYPYASNSLGVDLWLDKIALKDIADCLGHADAAGTIDVSSHLEIPGRKLHEIAMDGTFAVRDLRVAQKFTADSADGTMRLRDGRLDVNAMHVRRGEGSGKVNVTLDVAAPALLGVRATAAAWPIDLPHERVHFDLWGDTKLDVDLHHLSANGPVNLRANFAVADAQFGDITAAADLRGRAIALDKLDAKLLGGTAHGQATIDIDHPLTSSAYLKWQGIDLTQLRTLGPGWDDVSGKANGDAVIAPATETRPLEPMMLHVNFRPESAVVRGMPFVDSQVHGYANIGRIVLTDFPENPTTLNFAGGSMHLFARLSRHADQQLAMQVEANAANLNFDQIVHACDPKAEPMPGVLGGSVSLFGNPRDLKRLHGEATLHIRETDLANSDVIGLLYSIMNVGHSNGSGPTGRARADLRLEGTDLFVDSFRLFNRGVEIRAAGSINDIWRLPNSPLTGYAVGAARPLRDLKLPFMADVDVIMGVLQTNVTTVKVDGTVHDPKPKLAAFGEIGNALCAMLLGDVQGKSGGE